MHSRLPQGAQRLLDSAQLVIFQPKLLEKIARSSVTPDIQNSVAEYWVPRSRGE